MFVTVRVEESSYFRREGFDVRTEAEVSVAQAVLGGVIRIQGLYEDLNVRVPPGTSSHSVLTLSDRGFRRLDATNIKGKRERPFFLTRKVSLFFFILFFNTLSLRLLDILVSLKFGALLFLNLSFAISLLSHQATTLST